MTKGIGTVQDRGSGGSQPSQHIPPHQQVADERLAPWNEIVPQHVPRSRLDPLFAQGEREVGPALGPNGEIVLEDDALSVEKKMRSRVTVEHLVHQIHEGKPKFLGRAIPFSVPVRVSKDVEFERRAQRFRHGRRV